MHPNRLLQQIIERRKSMRKSFENIFILFRIVRTYQHASTRKNELPSLSSLPNKKKKKTPRLPNIKTRHIASILSRNAQCWLRLRAPELRPYGPDIHQPTISKCWDVSRFSSTQRSTHTSAFYTISNRIKAFVTKRHHHHQRTPSNTTTYAIFHKSFQIYWHASYAAL